MDKMEILSGNACFPVKNTSHAMSGKEFEDYLENEGFEKFRKYQWMDRGFFYININSLRYSPGVPKAAKLAETILGEDMKNAFSIDEFITIWNILKSHMGQFSSTDEITKATSAFCICDEILLKPENEFLDYLHSQNFTPLADDGYGSRGFAVVNVKSMIYSNGQMADKLISTFIGDNSACTITADEFKTIWNLLKLHKDTCSIEMLLDECREFDNPYKVLECCEKIFKINPDNLQATYYKALVLFDLKKYKDCLELIENAISRCPEDYRFCNLKAFILTDLYQISEAIECYNTSFYLGGFDSEDNESTYKYRAICYLKKAREDYYIRKDLKKANKSLNIYLAQFGDDKDALHFKDELSHGKITPEHTRYDEKIMYFETKAYELYSLGFLKESFEAYREVFEASQDFKRNADKTHCFDMIFGVLRTDIDNFRWYDEVLFNCLKQFSGNYREFFTNLFEISDATISACLDKAKLYCIINAELAITYSQLLLEKCPQNTEVREFYTKITSKNVNNKL